MRNTSWISSFGKVETYKTLRIKQRPRPLTRAFNEPNCRSIATSARPQQTWNPILISHARSYCDKSQLIPHQYVANVVALILRHNATEIASSRGANEAKACHPPSFELGRILPAHISMILTGAQRMHAVRETSAPASRTSAFYVSSIADAEQNVRARSDSVSLPYDESLKTKHIRGRTKALEQQP